MFVDFAEHHGSRSPIRFPPSSSTPYPTQKKKKKELSEEDKKKRNRERMRRRKDRYNKEKEVRLQHKLTYTQGMDQPIHFL